MRRQGWVLVVVVAVVAVVAGLLGGLIVRLTVSSGGAQSRSASGQAGVCDSIAVAHSTLPSVVTILTRTASGGSGNGSGEIIRDAGYILTNEHVISPGSNGGTVSVRYSDGKTTPATVVGEDALTDPRSSRPRTARMGGR